MKSIGLLNGTPRTIGNIYCIGRNYAKHAAELGNKVLEKPLVFLKATSALRGLSDMGLLAFPNETFHFECELVLLLGSGIEAGKPIKFGHIEALGLGIDLTRRDEQNRLKKEGHPWTTAKSFVGSAVLGDMIVAESAIDAEGLKALNFDFSLNGVEKQRGFIKDMITAPLALLNYVHEFSALQAGDLLFTGTPEGVGPIVKGDRFTMTLRQHDSILGTWQGAL